MTKPDTKSQSWWPFTVTIAILAALFGALAPSFVHRYHLSLPAALGIYFCFLVSLILVIAPGMKTPRAWLQARLQDRQALALLPFLWCSPYLLYTAGTHDFRWLPLIRLFTVAALPLLIYRLFPVRSLERFTWQDLAVAVCLIVALMKHQLAGIWNVPVNLDFMGRLFLITVGSWCWIFVRPVPQLGFEFFFSTRTWRAAASNFALFAIIAIPAGLAIGFTAWNPHRITLLKFAVDYLEIFLFIALLEELFFRGFLQTLISASLNSPRNGQILISCVFGLFHILHEPFPNWRYVILAAIAGWFYGTAFVKGGNLMASALTHAMVDTLWRTYFTKS